MKQGIKYIMIVVALAAVLALAIFGYNYLSERYQPGNEQGTTVDANTSGDTDIISPEQPEAVKQANDFTVTDINGNEVKLSDYFGKPIVINFWATWCGSCKSELPSFNKLYEENKDDIVFLMVNLTDGYRDTVDGVKAFVNDGGYTFPVYFDTQYSASDAYNVSSIPMTVFIDENGAESGYHIGAMGEVTLRGYLDDLK